MKTAKRARGNGAVSWPAAPNGNVVIDTACGMFSDLGMTIRSGDPRFWGTSVERADLYLIHWPDAIFWGNPSQKRLWFMIARVLTNLALLKARGTRILWFVHNLQPHDLSPDRQRAWNTYARGLSRLCDGWIALSPSTAEPVIDLYPALARKRYTFVWHPPYANAYGGTRVKARGELGLSEAAIVFGHAGLLRPYKNLAPLAQRFEEIAPEGATLLLAGMAKDGGKLSALSSQVRGLDYREGKLSQSQFDRALKAMDVFVAPYSRFLHSGALVHALSRGCVVVAPRAPFTEDLAQELGADWVVLYDGEPDAAVMSRAADAADRQARQAPNLTTLEPAQNLHRLRDLLRNLGFDMSDRTPTAPKPSR